ncbi:hypothetical protein ACP70R_035096 [Stipagrostis hirtigluma subsp. patula]
MISWRDVYKVAAAVVPLYVPLLLGFWSVRRWRIFTPEQCETVNRLVAVFAIPFFTFGFTVHADPFRANYRAIAADVVSKLVVAAAIAAWVLATGARRGAAVNWSITSFSLSTLTSSLVVGVPMARAMYGEWAQQLVVQLSVFQAIVWLTLLIFALEVRKAAIGDRPAGPAIDDQAQEGSRQIINDVEAASTADAAAAAVDDIAATSSTFAQSYQQVINGVDPDSTARALDGSHRTQDDVEAVANDVDDASSTFPQSPQGSDDLQVSDAAAVAAEEGVVPAAGGRPSLWALVKVVSCKLLRNPNTCASLGGVILACIANRLQISLPVIIENSIAIMARCGNGLAMFSMGLFMAQQDNLIPCGPSLTFLGLVLKFVLDPIAMTIGSIAVGLRGDVVRVAIIQAAVPQSITSFIFAKEYGLHPDVLSTAVIVGMVVSVPLIILFYVGLEGLC